jgi:hypothetical protein
LAIVLKNRYVFLHIPKTGGEWFTTCLKRANLTVGEVGEKHCDIQGLGKYRTRQAPTKIVREFYRRLYLSDTPITFTLIRNPFDWYCSYWSFRNDDKWEFHGKIGSIKKYHPWNELSLFDGMEFNDFVDHVTKKRPGIYTHLVNNYLFNSGCIPIRLENLVTDMETVLRQSDYPKLYEVLREIPASNKSSSSKQLKESMTEQVKQKIAFSEQFLISKYYNTD